MKITKQFALIALTSLGFACADNGGKSGQSGQSGQSGSQTGTEGAGASNEDVCDSPADDYAICTEPGEVTRCYEYRYDPLLLASQGIEELESNCLQTEGATFSPSSQCPDTPDLLGSCVYGIPLREESTMAVFFYGEEPTQAAQAQLACELMETVSDDDNSETQYDHGMSVSVTWCPQ